MVFVERLAAGKFAVALEITPPQQQLPKVLLRRARLIGEWAHAVNVIQRPGRQASLDASLALHEGGLHPAWHLVTRGSTRTDIARDIERARAGGIRQILCIRGDHKGVDSADTPTLRETIAMVAEAMPGAMIGATLNQYAPDPAAVLRNVLPKLRAGATYVQTQPVFDLEALRPLAEAVQDGAPGTKIIAMAMPLLSLDEADRIEARLGIRLPEAFRTRLAGGEEAAWNVFEETLAMLAESSLVAGVAIMTLKLDPPADMGERIVSAITRSGIER